MPPRITLLTDFGTRDGYVGAMKGVIALICPNALIDDASHDIPHGEIVHAAYTLRRYWKLYPPGTIHVVVVDPGVGSERRAVAVSADERLLIGPDNGVLSLALRDCEQSNAVELTVARFQRAPRSATFHGRDVFAPAAAHLACGLAIAELGASATNLVMLPVREPEVSAQRVRGEVISIDRFGNLITNLPASLTEPDHVLAVKGRLIPVRGTYAQARVGEALALVNSDGLIEIAVRNGNAAAVLQIERGTEVELRHEKEAGT
jgi:S-adenosylmethionine hydrolase